MSKNHVEERLAALEEQVNQLQAEVKKLTPDWRRTIGMFGNEPIMKQIDEEAQKIREADRRKARKRPVAKQE